MRPKEIKVKYKGKIWKIKYFLRKTENGFAVEYPQLRLSWNNLINGFPDGWIDLLEVIKEKKVYKRIIKKENGKLL
jgi:hypothetical protein